MSKRTMKDKTGRVWTYEDAEGTWEHGSHVIGCSGSNGRKWQVWSVQRGPVYDTLREAMLSC
ncbi:MAG: hypothetical protein ACR2NF_07185 [Pirellulales bacterium]